MEFISITRELSKQLPGFVTEGSLMLLPPAKDILRGIYFEPSAADKRSFYVTVFVLPLFVPTDHIYFNLGERVGISWNADDKDLLPELAEVLKREALPFLNRMGNLQGLTQALIHNSPDARTQQAIAYGLAMKGDIEQALVALDLLILSLEVEFPWQQNTKDQAQALRTVLTENSSLAQRWLQTWEAETRQHLGLEKFR